MNFKNGNLNWNISCEANWNLKFLYMLDSKKEYDFAINTNHRNYSKIK